MGRGRAPDIDWTAKFPVRGPGEMSLNSPIDGTKNRLERCELEV